jgi:phosphonate transport system permease protein
MSTSSQNVSYPSSWQKPPFIENPLLRWGLIVGAVIYLTAALGTMEIDIDRVMEGLPRGKRFLDAFFPPNFADNRGVMWEGILESIWMAIISTVVGIAISVPVGLGAAKNLAPAWVYLACRSIIAGSRTFPEIILAIFAVKLFGFGPFAGFIALSLGTIGFFC